MFYQILALIIWSSSFIAAKYVYGGIDPALMVGVRLLIAALPALPAAVMSARFRVRNGSRC